MSDWFFGPFFAVFGILTLVAVIVWIWALVDCLQVSDDSLYQSGNKLIWVLIIVLANWVGALLYFVIGRPDTRTTSGTFERGEDGPAIPPPPPGTTR